MRYEDVPKQRRIQDLRAAQEDLRTSMQKILDGPASRIKSTSKRCKALFDQMSELADRYSLVSVDTTLTERKKLNRYNVYILPEMCDQQISLSLGTLSERHPFLRLRNAHIILTCHVLERVIQRQNTDNFRETLGELETYIFFLVICFEQFLEFTDFSKGFVILNLNGYVVFEPDNERPYTVLKTFLPRQYWRENFEKRFSEVIAFCDEQDDEECVVISLEDFNNKNVITLSDVQTLIPNPDIPCFDAFVDYTLSLPQEGKINETR